MTGYKSKLAAAQDKITDEQGRPMTYWGGKAQPAQELAIPSTQDAASKVGPFWQEFSVVYEAIGKQQITIREIAWRCFLAAKMTTQPAQEPVAWMVYTLDGASVCVTDNPADFTPEHRALPLYTIPPQRKPLTQDGTMEIANQTAGQYWMDEAHIQRFRAAVEAAHGIKE